MPPDAAAASAAPAAPGDILLDVKRFEVAGANPLSDAETAAALAPYLGTHRSLGTLEAGAAALEARLREGGYSFHRVIIPAQKPTDGVVKLEILQFPLAAVEVTGNQHFSADNIQRSLPGLVTGSSPDVRAVSRDLGLANEHPAKRVSIVLKESTKADALDAEIRVRDTAPELFFASLTGNTRDAYNDLNQTTGYTRLTLGYQNSNLFDLDHAVDPFLHDLARSSGQRQAVRRVLLDSAVWLRDQPEPLLHPLGSQHRRHRTLRCFRVQCHRQRRVHGRAPDLFAAEVRADHAKRLAGFG
ncbi:MAG: hypothetical protein IPI44_09035 [Sulfuritalea sp.]|nr:hypothetical protein [Sulfuritalea sp.]